MLSIVCIHKRDGVVRIEKGGGMKKRYVVGKSGKRVTARREIKAKQRTRRNKGEANKGPLSERE